MFCLLEHGVTILFADANLEGIHEDAAFSNKVIAEGSFIPALNNDSIFSFSFPKIKCIIKLWGLALSKAGSSFEFFFAHHDFNINRRIGKEASTGVFLECQFVNSDF